MTDIKQRLTDEYDASADPLMEEAADRIEELEAEIAGMKLAIATFDALNEQIVEMEKTIRLYRHWAKLAADGVRVEDIKIVERNDD